MYCSDQKGNSFPKNTKLFFVFLALSVLALASCASPKILKMNNEESKETVSKYDSLKVKMTLSFEDDQKKKQEFSGVLFVQKGTRYRLELMGPLGIGVASLLWSDNEWTMTFPTEKRFLKGRGPFVGIVGNIELPLIDIHQLTNIFYGEFLPEHSEVEIKNIEGVERRVAKDKYGRSMYFEQNKDTKEVSSLSQVGFGGLIERLDFKDYRDFQRKRLPSQLVYFRDAKKILEIQVKRVQNDAKWGEGIWKLHVPNTYKSLTP